MPRTAPTTRRAAVLATAAALLLTGCGGSGDDTEDVAAPDTSSAAPSSTAAGTGTAPSSEAPDEAGGTLTVTGVDFDYELESTELAAGEYEIEFVNEGDASHNVVVEKDGEDVAMSEVIGSGETTTVSVTLEPGEYIFYCSVANHRGMGMEVPVTVT